MNKFQYEFLIFITIIRFNIDKIDIFFLSTFYKFLVITSVIDINPTVSMATPKKDKRIPVFITEQEITKLFDLPDIDLRDRAMLELLYSSGIRIEELVSRNLKDINLLSGMLKVLGKGGKERYTRLPNIVIKCLRLWK